MECHHQQWMRWLDGIQSEDPPTQPAAPQESSPEGTPPDGFFEADGFRYGGAVVRFGGASHQYRLVEALWDKERGEPASARKEQDVIEDVYGHDHEPGKAWQKLRRDTNQRLLGAGCLLRVQAQVGNVCLARQDL